MVDVVSSALFDCLDPCLPARHENETEHDIRGTQCDSMMAANVYQIMNHFQKNILILSRLRHRLPQPEFISLLFFSFSLTSCYNRHEHFFQWHWARLKTNLWQMNRMRTNIYFYNDIIGLCGAHKSQSQIEFNSSTNLIQFRAFVWLRTSIVKKSIWYS